MIRASDRAHLDELSVFLSAEHAAVAAGLLPSDTIHAGKQRASADDDESRAAT
jgi:hypothetical protein